MSQAEKLQDLARLLRTCRRQTSSVDLIHGMLTAAICGPLVVRPAQWLPVVFPGTRDYKKLLAAPTTESIVQIMLDLYEDVLFSVRQATFVPYLAGTDGSGTTLKEAQGWCTGFLHGMGLHGKEWLDDKDQHIAELTAPIFYIADPKGVSSMVGKKSAKKLSSMEKNLIEAIRYNIPAIYDHWNMGRKVEEKKKLFGDDSQ
jgi:yecA family protein